MISYPYTARPSPRETSTDESLLLGGLHLHGPWNQHRESIHFLVLQIRWRKNNLDRRTIRRIADTRARHVCVVEVSAKALQNAGSSQQLHAPFAPAGWVSGNIRQPSFVDSGFA